MQELYRRYLCRAADPAGQDALMALLQRGVPKELVLASVVGSEEYFGSV